MRTAPLLREDEARHLVQDSDSELRSYLAEIGSLEEQGMVQALSSPQSACKTPQELARINRMLNPMKLRLFRNVPERWGMQKLDRYREWLMSLPPESQLRIAQISMAVEHAVHLPDPKGAVDTLLVLEKELSNVDRRVYLGHVYGGLADCYRRAMEREPHIRFRRLSIAEAMRVGNYGFACQAYGELGSAASTLDSLLAAWDRGFRLALKIEDVNQIARFYSFFSNLFLRHGNLAASLEFSRLALESCRRLKGEAVEARYLLSWIKINERLGCLDLVQEDMLRIPPLLRRTRENPRTRYVVPGWQMSFDRLRAHLAMVHGDVDRASELYEELEKETRNVEQPLGRLDPMYDYAQGLVENGRLSRAISVATAAREYAQRVRYPDFAARLGLIVAQARLAQDQTGGVDSLLDFADRNMFMDASRIPDWALLAALQTRRLLAEGRRNEALDSLRVGLVRFESLLGMMDPTEQAYFSIRRGEPLLELMHELAGDNAGLGYAIEMAWNGLGSAIGSGYRETSATDGNLVALVDRLRHPRVPLPPPPLPKGTLHLVYRVGEDRVTRWEADHDGFRETVLPVSPKDLWKQVDRALDVLIAASQPAGTEASRPLFDLGHSLLPKACFDGSVSEMAVTPDLFLDLLPFGALSLDAETYRPLLASTEVVRVRTGGTSPVHPPAGPGLMVSGPRLSQRLRLRHAGLLDLPFGAREAARVATLVPGAAVLSGDAARKQAVTAAWKNQSFLYFATHVVTDPSIPYLSFIPLSPAAGAPDSEIAGTRLADEYLGTYDIRTTDMSACRLVVLSGCSSGKPYVNAHTAAISLGDAFVDAGARTVIQTAWDVGDENAAALMTRFVTLWAGENLSPVQALTQARREAMSGDGPGASVWAAYTVTVRSLDDLLTPGSPGLQARSR